MNPLRQVQRRIQYAPRAAAGMLAAVLAGTIGLWLGNTRDDWWYGLTITSTLPYVWSYLTWDEARNAAAPKQPEEAA